MNADANRTLVGEVFHEASELMRVARDSLSSDVAELANDIATALDNGCKLVTFGNGGSAADAQHFAAEMTGRFSRPRAPLAAVALTTDTSALTAIANDFGYEHVFERQVQALCRTGDVAVGISTSGRSDSVIAGVAAARRLGVRTWALCGGDGGPLARASDRAIVVPSSNTARIQEVHITAIHAVCAMVDRLLIDPTQDG